jgi:hypothetical protein
VKRGAARVTFVAALVLGVAVLCAAAFAALTPKPVAITPEHEVAIAKLANLTDRAPQAFVVPELKGLDNHARVLRNRGPYQAMGGRTPRAGDLEVFLVKIDDQVRGFIALDPRNSCRLLIETPGAKPDGTLAFHDSCHGSLYDVNGERIGGPSPWALDQLVVSVRDGRVYAETNKVLPGRLYVTFR